MGGRGCGSMIELGGCEGVLAEVEGSTIVI